MWEGSLIQVVVGRSTGRLMDAPCLALAQWMDQGRKLGQQSICMQLVLKNLIPKPDPFLTIPWTKPQLHTFSMVFQQVLLSIFLSSPLNSSVVRFVSSFFCFGSCAFALGFWDRACGDLLWCLVGEGG